MPWHKHLNASLKKWERWFSTDDRLWFLQSWCEDLNLFVSHFWSEENKLGWEIKRVNFHRHCFSSTLQWDLERTTAASQLPGCRVKKRTLKENLRQEELPHRQKPHRNDGIKWKERQKDRKEEGTSREWRTQEMVERLLMPSPEPGSWMFL